MCVELGFAEVSCLACGHTAVVMQVLASYHDELTQRTSLQAPQTNDQREPRGLCHGSHMAMGSRSDLELSSGTLSW